MEVHVHEAKTHLSRLLERVAWAKRSARTNSDSVRQKESLLSGMISTIHCRKTSGIFSINEARGEGLEDGHRDHFDRILIAEALPEKWPIVTSTPSSRAMLSA